MTCRAARRAVPLAVAVLVLAAVGRAVAAWTSATTASQTTSTVSLIAPASLTATASGHDVALNWPAATAAGGYALTAAANGTSSNCATPATALAATTATSYTDSGRYAPQGTWYCYTVAARAGAWTSQAGNPTTAVQLGFVATSVDFTNGGTSGRLDTGDTITITFNQPVAASSGPSVGDTVCATASSSGQINLATTTTSGTCATSETLDIGSLTGVNSSRNARYAATYTWTNTNTKLTITLGARNFGGQDPTIAGTLTLTPTTTTTRLRSATGSYHICDTNTGGGNCTPRATGTA